MRPVALLQWASYPDRRRTLLIACGLALLLVCQLYGQLRQQKETKRSPSSFADVDIATASRSLMMAPPQGPKHACVSDDWMVRSFGIVSASASRTHSTDRLSAPAVGLF